MWVHVAASVEASLADRGPDEGWLVTMRNPLLTRLRQLVTSDQDGGFLILSVGDYYVQFLKDSAKSTLYCEAISDTYLPPKLRLAPESVRRFLSFGFERPDAICPNYHISFDLNEAERFLSSMASLVVKVMAEVYDVGQNAKLDVRLDLQG